MHVIDKLLSCYLLIILCILHILSQKIEEKTLKRFFRKKENNCAQVKSKFSRKKMIRMKEFFYFFVINQTH